MKCECQNIIIEAIEYYKTYITFIIIIWITSKVMFSRYK